jgi:cell shape-determining protein MreC
MRRYWKKGLIALVLVVALIFILTSMACGSGGGATVLSPFQVLNNTVASHTTKINANTNSFTTVNLAIATLRTDLETGLAGIINVPNFTSNITSLNAQIASLKASDNATQMAIDTVAGKVETVKTNVATMQLLVDAMMDNFNTLSYRLDLIETSLNMSP